MKSLLAFFACAFALQCIAGRRVDLETIIGNLGSSESFERIPTSVESNSNADTKVWAVLIAGSSGYWNYRHQADICHAYHILIGHGIPASNIITMMYDDVANDRRNPYPGKLYNDPTSMKDYYAGTKIDYRGKSVTPKNFMAILKGDKAGVKGGNGRVLESTANDKVFVYFADHGASGLIAFPDGGDVLTVKELSDTMSAMHAKNMYSELTFYLEACESGSMFDNTLTNKLKIYAVTAANSHESSWGCYCGTKLIPGNCLGDLFSVNWMQDSDKENLNTETLEDQYKIVKQETNLSHVLQFGDKDIWNEHVSEFHGDEQAYSYGDDVKPSPHDYAQWPSRDIQLMGLMMERDRALAENSILADSLNHNIHVLQKKRRYLESEMVKIVKKAVHDPNTRNRVLTQYPSSITKQECHHNVVHTFNRICFNVNLNPYALKYIYVLSNLCELGIDSGRLVTMLMDHCVDLGDITGIL